MKKVFFIDVDNTLLDNDHLVKEIKNSLVKTLGKKETGHFWDHYLEIRENTKIINFSRNR